MQIEFDYDGKYYRAEIELEFDSNGESLAINYSDYALPANEIPFPNMYGNARYKIYNFMADKTHNEFVPPYDIDFSNFGFHKKRTLVKGELIKVEHYAEYDGTTYNNLIVREDNVYIRNPITGYVATREKSIVWIDANENESEPKHTIKHYNNTEAIDEGEVRRSNIINHTKIVAIGLILATEFGNDPTKFVDAENMGKEFVADVAVQIQQYKDGIRQHLIDAFNNSTYPFMDNPISATHTIRSYLIEELTY